MGPKPAHAATTVTALLAASTLTPKPVAKILHPVVTAGVATAVSLVLEASVRGMATTDQALKEYMNGGQLGGGGLFGGGRGGGGGGGDYVAALMSAAVSALGLRMFDSRSVLQDNWRPLIGGAGVASLFSLFTTPWAAGKVAQLPPQLGLALSQRSVGGWAGG